MEVLTERDRARGVVRVAWRLAADEIDDRGRAPVQFHPSIGMEGLWLRQPATGDPWIDFPWSFVSGSVPVELSLRVAVELDDGSMTDTLEAPWVVPPRYDVPVSQRWTAGPTEVVVPHRGRRRAGLNAWVDGCMGFAELNGAIHGFVANGAYGEEPSGVARWRIDGEDFLAEVSSTHAGIEGETAHYVGGGPVYADGSGLLLLLYHAEVWVPDERHPEGNPLRFWSFIGLATSSDGGVTWRSLGRIIEPELPVDAEVRPFLTEVCGAPYVVRDGDMYVYFRDTRANATAVNLCVARAPVAEVIAAARTGTSPPTFHKWHDGAWAEPGLGGRATDMLPDSPDLRWFDVVELVDRGLYVLVQSDGFARDWAHLVRTSTDGLTWSPPERVPGPAVRGERLYLTLASPSLVPQRQVTGDAVDLYQVRSAGGFSARWDDAVLERTRLQLRR